MTARDPLFVTGPGGAGQTSPTEARLAMAGLVATGTGGTNIRQGIFQAVTTNIVTGLATMAYQVGTFAAATQRSSSGGVYLGVNDGAGPVATTAAPGSGSRWDLIWIHFRDIEQGDPDSTGQLGVTQGTAGGSPVKPYSSVPVGALVLAEALVPAGISGTTGATITQVFQWTVARGAPVPVRNQAERDAMTARSGLVVRRLDQDIDQLYTSAGEWRPHGALTLLGQTTRMRIAAGHESGTTSSTGNIVIETGLSSLVICVATPASGGTWANATMQRIGEYDGGNATYRWRDGDTGKALTGVSVAVDWIAIGTD